MKPTNAKAPSWWRPGSHDLVVESFDPDRGYLALKTNSPTDTIQRTLLISLVKDRAPHDARWIVGWRTMPTGAAYGLAVDEGKRLLDDIQLRVAFGLESDPMFLVNEVRDARKKKKDPEAGTLTTLMKLLQKERRGETFLVPGFFIREAAWLAFARPALQGHYDGTFAVYVGEELKSAVREMLDQHR